MMHLDVELRDCKTSLDRLIRLHANLHVLPAGYQKLVAEIVMVRLFDLFQNHLKRIVCKVASGCVYLDGTFPLLLHQSRSMSGAENAMKTVSRAAKPRHNLRWSKVREIKENARFVIDPTDHLLVTLDRHGQVIDEMRRVRNRITHNNKQSRRAYSNVVRQKYGARVRGVTPGTLLLSPRWTSSVLETYLRSTRVLVSTLVKG